MERTSVFRSYNELTSVVSLTPPGRGAVATLLVDGPAARRAVDEHFRPAARGRKLSDFPLQRLVFGRWGGAAGEEIVACRTAEDGIELCCHGGRIASQRIEQDLAASGCRPIEWSQWMTAGAEGDALIRAEAQIALAQARTQRAAAILLDQLNGTLETELHAIEQLTTIDPPAAAARISVLLARAPLGMHLTRPWRIVLAGQPNVGKSSLINAILGYERAIVFDQPGTTRDVVTAATAIDGWPVELADTAGLREASDSLEAAGVARARRQMQSADLLLLVFDRAQPWTAADAALVAQWPQALLLYNKLDLPAEPAVNRPEGIALSAVTGRGVDELLAAIARRLVPEPPPLGAAVPFTLRHMQYLERCRTEMRAKPPSGGQ